MPAVAPTGSSFDSMSIEDLYHRVRQDDPDKIYEQASDWDAVATTLESQADTLHARMTSVTRSWTGESNASYIEQLLERRDSLVAAAEVAKSNAGSWRNVAGSVAQARRDVTTQYQAWVAERDLSKSPADQAKAREKFDVAVGRRSIPRCRPPAGTPAAFSLRSRTSRCRPWTCPVTNPGSTRPYPVVVTRRVHRRDGCQAAGTLMPVRRARTRWAACTRRCTVARRAACIPRYIVARRAARNCKARAGFPVLRLRRRRLRRRPRCRRPAVAAAVW